MTLRAFIADDEPLARELLARWVHQNPDLHLVGQAGDGAAVPDAIEKLEVDVLFLDIQMPRLDGLAALEQLRQRNSDVYVIFVTARNQHAVSAFDLAAGDYLVKPVRKSRFAEAVKRAVEFNRLKECARIPGEQMPALMVKDGDRTTPVRLSNIIWVEAASQYAYVHTLDSEYLISKPLAELASQLPDQSFIRVHRSALVNLDCIRHIKRKQGNYSLELSNGVEVPIARSRREDVINRLQMQVSEYHVSH